MHYHRSARIKRPVHHIFDELHDAYEGQITIFKRNRQLKITFPGKHRTINHNYIFLPRGNETEVHLTVTNSTKTLIGWILAPMRYRMLRAWARKQMSYL